MRGSGRSLLSVMRGAWRHNFEETGRPIEGGLNTLAARDQPTCATRSWAFASTAVAGCAGSWSTVAS